MAERSNDQWLIGALKSGKDIHCYMASDTEKIPYDEFYAVYKNKNHKLHSAYNTIRNNTKNITFGVPLTPVAISW
jgi:DNA polymerase I-like protein with 3'-5' exonuclease and polymerase domains